MFRYFLCAFLVSVVIQNAKGSNNNDELIVRMEPQCASQGGMCMNLSDCPKGMESAIGSCPKQRDLGAICCEALPISEHRCQRRGGECMKYCTNRKFLITGTSDCPQSEPECCLLI